RRYKDVQWLPPAVELARGAEAESRAETSLAARSPLRKAPSISACQRPAVCSPAKATAPTGRASASSSSGEERARAEYAPRAHGSSCQVESSGGSAAKSRSGRSCRTASAHLAGPRSTSSTPSADGEPANEDAAGTGSPSGPRCVHVQKRSGTESVWLGTRPGGTGDASG